MQAAERWERRCEHAGRRRKRAIALCMPCHHPPNPPSPRSGTLRSVAQSWASATSAYFEEVKTKGVKMPVHVDVDFIGPFALGVKRNVVRAWKRLPPGAREAAPYVGVAVGSGGAVSYWLGRRVAFQRSRANVAVADATKLAADNAKLRDAVKTLRAQAAVPRAAADIKSAAVVAEATAAAAAAAMAAAEAAKACAVKLRHGGGG